VAGARMGETPINLRVLSGVTEVTLEKKCFETTVLPVKLPAEPKDPITLSGSLRKKPGCR
jgi:hypothetical protein